LKKGITYLRRAGRFILDMVLSIGFVVLFFAGMYIGAISIMFLIDVGRNVINSLW